MSELLELIFKLPKDKPPFIGVVFEKEFTAERFNQKWINSYRNDDYKIVFESYNEGLNLRLTSSIGCNTVYENLKFDKDKLRRFLYLTKSTKRFNFGHVTIKNDKHIVARTSVNGCYCVLKITKVILLTEY